MVRQGVRGAFALAVLGWLAVPAEAARYNDRQMLAIINTTVDMLNDRRPEVRLEGLGDLVEVLGELHGGSGEYGIYTETVAKFLPGMKAMIERDPHPKVRQEAARHLHTVVELLYNHVEQKIRTPLHPLLQGLLPLITAMANHPDVAIRFWGVKLLGLFMQADSQEVLLTRLTDVDARVRVEAMKALSSFYTDERILPGIVAALKDPVIEVRMQAAESLAGFQDLDTVPALLAAAQDGSVLVRRCVLGALSRFNDPRALDVLERGLTDPDPWIRRGALSGLGGKGPKGWALLAKAQQDPDVETRRMVLDAGLRGGTPGLLLVARALQDTHWEVWSRAADFIRRLDLPSPPLDPEQARAVWEAVKPCLLHKEVNIRQAAVAAAAWCRKEDVLPSVRAALKDPDGGVQMFAQKTLGLLGEMEGESFEPRR